MDRLLNGLEPAVPPPSTMIGALYRWLRDASPAEFQPMNSNFGLLEPLAQPIRDKGARRARLVERAGEDFDAWIDTNAIREERFAREPVATMPGGSP
jgi:methylenetetrahydrofolate--tRNA-(uracil-5-)-methyltransferase